MFIRSLLKVSYLFLLASQFYSGSASAENSNACTASSRGKLLSTTLLDRKTPAQLSAYFDDFMAVEADFLTNDVVPQINYGADIYKLNYCTVDFNGAPTIASGVISIPISHTDRRFSTVLYEHGTSVTRIDTVSNLDVEVTFDGPSPLVFFTGAGYIYIAADYLAYGDSTLPRHRYFHAASEANCAADLYAAAKKSDPYKDAQKTNKLFLFGFSQGGHVSMALQRSFESMQAAPRVTAQATVGGVYDPEAWIQKTVFETDGAVDLPVYHAFITLAYQDVYHIYNNINGVFQPPFNQTVEGLYDMNHFFFEVQEGLPTLGTDLFTQPFLAQLQNNPSMAFRARLRENEVYKWKPKAPVNFFHSRDDDEVPYELAKNAYNYMKAHGAPITLTTLNGYDHLNSWHHAMPQVIQWFNTF